MISKDDDNEDEDYLENDDFKYAIYFITCWETNNLLRYSNQNIN